MNETFLFSPNSACLVIHKNGKLGKLGTTKKKFCMMKRLPFDIWLHHIVLPHLSAQEVKNLIVANREAGFFVKKEGLLWSWLIRRDFRRMVPESSADESLYWKIRTQHRHNIPNLASLNFVSFPRISPPARLIEEWKARKGPHYIDQAVMVGDLCFAGQQLCVVTQLGRSERRAENGTWIPGADVVLQPFGNTDPGHFIYVPYHHFAWDIMPVEIDFGKAMSDAALLDVQDDGTALVLLEGQTEACSLPLPDHMQHLGELLDAGNKVNVQAVSILGQIFCVNYQTSL